MGFGHGDLNALINDMAPVWRRTLGKAIDLQSRLAGNLWSTRAYPGQVESAILNFVINARDAMLEGGFLGVATQNVSHVLKIAEWQLRELGYSVLSARTGELPLPRAGDRLLRMGG